MKCTVIKPDSEVQEVECWKPAIFLAGSIEMGRAEDWQQTAVDFFADADVVLYNPRRDSWNSDWEQRIHNPEFKAQVDWELDRLEECDVILMYFDTNTMSPISLLELGMYLTSEKLIVVCPDNFWRKGNVEIVCHREGVPMFDTLEQAIQDIKEDFNFGEN